MYPSSVLQDNPPIYCCNIYKEMHKLPQFSLWIIIFCIVSNNVGGQMLCRTTIGAQHYSIPKSVSCDKLKIQLTGTISY